jgi:hypothetical protein
LKDFTAAVSKVDMMHRNFLLGLVPLTCLLNAGCSEPLHVGDVLPGKPACEDLWATKIGDDVNGASVTHAVDATGNIFLVGGFTGVLGLGTSTLTSQGEQDVLVAKLTSDGAPIWSKRFGDEKGQVALGVATDGSGNVIVTGIAQGTVDFGGGPRTATEAGQAFLVKLDPSGNHLWSELLGSIPGAPSVSVDASGGIVLSGSGNGALDLDGSMQPSADASSFVAKLDSDGHLLWEKTFVSADISAKTNRTGDIALIGSFSETFSLGGAQSPLVAADSTRSNVVARLDAQGNEIYKLQYGSVSDGATDGIIDESGNVAIVGVSLSGPFLLGAALIPGDRSYIIKLNPAGFVVYSRVGNDQDYSHGLPLALTAIKGDNGESSIHVLGQFHRFDASPLTTDTSAATNGVPDFAGCQADDGDSTFVVGLGPQGELTSCRLFSESSYGFNLGPNRLWPGAITDGGSGRLLLSGGFAGHETFDCATLESDPLTLDNPLQPRPGFIAKIAR